MQRIYGNQPQADETGVFSTDTAQDRWFSHLSVTVPKEGTSSEWCELVGAAEYGAPPQRLSPLIQAEAVTNPSSVAVPS